MLPRSQLVALAARANQSVVVDKLLKGNPLAARRVRETIRAFDSADLGERRRLTDQLTVRIIKQARRAGYGRNFGMDYETWPVLTKARVRDASGDFTTGGGLHIPASTGGTSGIPLALWRSPASLAAEQVFLDCIIKASGRTWSRSRVVCLRGSHVKSLDDWAPPFGIETHRGRRLVFSTPHIAPETLSWFFDKLEAFRPELMWIWPTAAATLLQLDGRGRGLRLPLVVSSSEQLMPELRREIAQAWGARVIDYYGQAERSCFAASWRQGEYWFQPAYGKVELRPTPSDEIVDGHRHVPIVATGFWNGAMPLVRYDTGDCAIVRADCSKGQMEEIALGLRPFSGVAGRREEYLVSLTGNRIPGLNQLPREINHLLQMQIVQRRPDCIVIRAVVRPGFGASDRERLMANARAKIPPTIAVEIETTDRLESSAHGKTPFIIRHPSGADACAV